MERNIFHKLRKVELMELLLDEEKELNALQERLATAEQRPVEDIREEFSCPDIEHLEALYKKEVQQKDFWHVLKSTVSTLLVVAAVAVLLAVFAFPVFKIYGHSMTPALTDGDVVVAVRQSEFQTGDIVAFYYNNKILVKRVIAQAGDWVDIGEDGTVYVNNEPLDEPYLTEKARGDCDIELPYQVPEGWIFVMGDHRSVSVDSRNTSIGCIAQEQIAGRLVGRIWPLSRLRLWK